MARLARDADTTRSRGYAIEVGEFEEGVGAVAAAVFAGGEAVAALGASGPELDVEAVGQRAAVLAAELSEALAESNG